MKSSSLGFKIATFYIAFFSFPLLAGDWICKEVASQRQGNAILACGIGIAATEPAARLSAVQEAKKEFDEVCRLSADCVGHTVTITPLRNDCAPYNSGHRCYRGIRFEIGELVSSDLLLQQRSNALDEEIRRTEAKLAKMRILNEKKNRLRTLRRQETAGDISTTSEKRRPASSAYADTKWGMTLSKVRKMYPHGFQEKIQNGQISYRVVRPVAGLMTGYIDFTFDPKLGLEAVAVMFPEQGTEVNLEAGTFLEMKTASVPELFQRILNTLTEKYGTPQMKEATKAAWFPAPETMISAHVLKSQVHQDRSTIAISYSRFEKGTLSKGL